jgi:hypothetical protein
MNTLSDITNIENDTEVIFVHALNIKYSLVCVKPFPKKAGYFNFSRQLFSEIRKCIVGCIFNSVKYPVLIKVNTYITPTIVKFSFVFPKCKHAE